MHAARGSACGNRVGCDAAVNREVTAVVTMPRTAPGSVVFASYNLLDLFATQTAAAQDRYRLVVEVIRDVGADVLAVQEIRAQQPEEAAANLRKLAGDVGMLCQVPNRDDKRGRAAIAVGPQGYHCGLLWRTAIEPVPGSFWESPAGRLWHGAGWLTLDVGGVRVRHATFHASPFGRRIRADQNELLVAMLTGGRSGAIPLLAGADWNTESADRIVDEATGDLVLYEPADPFAAAPWFGGMVYQCDWSYDEHGSRIHWADRRPGDVLFAGGLLDAAAVLRAPWQPTAGYYPGDMYGDRGIMRRIDAIRVTKNVAPALRAYHVTDTEVARRASDHLPVSVEYVPAQIAAG